MDLIHAVALMIHTGKVESSATEKGHQNLHMLLTNIDLITLCNFISQIIYYSDEEFKTCSFTRVRGELEGLIVKLVGWLPMTYSI
jgi:hypothetical protein